MLVLTLTLFLLAHYFFCLLNVSGRLNITISDSEKKI